MLPELVETEDRFIKLLIGKIGEYDQGITPESLVAGLDWAIDAGAHIIALLVDFRELNTGQKQSLQEAINRALARNVLLLAPVGNSIERRPEDRYPASLEGVLSVGAHDIYGQRCAFSAKSYQLDLLAPGEGLLTSNLEQLPTGNLKSTVIATALGPSLGCAEATGARAVPASAVAPRVATSVVREVAVLMRTSVV